MALSLYDSKTRALRPFQPMRPGHVGLYVCGATVQSGPHVGHLRTALAFDVLVRWLQESGYQVTYVRNVTDIDDKILAKSAEAGEQWWARAYHFENEFTAAYDALGMLRPSYEPRATGHIPEMIELTARLIERGHAYAGERGNVYFAVQSWQGYGSLTNQPAVVDSPCGESEAAADKRDPRDFALFKAPRPGEPETAQWATPWGPARPGWHLECSAMAHRYLGEQFDIHGGGLDLRFPHHENEQAQSEAAGYRFVGTWMHSAWVVQAGEKMSKSLGNTLDVSAVLAQVPAPVVRLALIGAHYRSMLEFSQTTILEARANWERFSGFVRHATEQVGEPAAGELPAEFVAALDDDLAVPAALAIIHDKVKAGNNALAAGDLPGVARELGNVRRMLAVLGLDPLAPTWSTTSGESGLRGALDAVVPLVLNEREAARRAKDWAKSDAIRDGLAQAGIVIEDRAGGAAWHLKGQ